APSQRIHGRNAARHGRGARRRGKAAVETAVKLRLPVMLDVDGRACVVIGGGRVAARKVSSLLECNAQVTVVSPAALPELRLLAGAGRLTWHARPYSPGDLDAAFLAIAATDSKEVNGQVVADAR